MNSKGEILRANKVRGLGAVQTVKELRGSIGWWNFGLRRKLKAISRDRSAASAFIRKVNERIPASAKLSRETNNRYRISLGNRLWRSGIREGSDTPILDRLLQVLQWLTENREELIKIIGIFF